jgi:hypothetical protein
MAGGMNRRGVERVSLHERIHGAPPAAAVTDLPVGQGTPSDQPRVRHCWVTGEHGRLPGLLLEWRRTHAGWQGRVVHPIDQGGSWVIVEDWVAAEHLEPGGR